MSSVPLRDTVKIGMGVRGMYKEVEKLEGQVKKQTIYKKYRVNQEWGKRSFCVFSVMAATICKTQGSLSS